MSNYIFCLQTSHKYSTIINLSKSPTYIYVTTHTCFSVGIFSYFFLDRATLSSINHKRDVRIMTTKQPVFEAPKKLQIKKIIIFGNFSKKESLDSSNKIRKWQHQETWRTHDGKYIKFTLN